MGTTTRNKIFDKTNKSNYGAVSEEATTAGNDVDRNGKAATPKRLNAYHTVDIDARRKNTNIAAEIPTPSRTRNKKIPPKRHVRKLSDVDQDSSSSDEEPSILEKGEAPFSKRSKSIDEAVGEAFW
jgi:hypothetical protein